MHSALKISSDFKPSASVHTGCICIHVLTFLCFKVLWSHCVLASHTTQTSTFYHHLKSSVAVSHLWLVYFLKFYSGFKTVQASMIKVQCHLCFSSLTAEMIGVRYQRHEQHDKKKKRDSSLVFVSAFSQLQSLQT